MKEGYIKVKDWFIEKTEQTSKRYNTWIDIFSRNEMGKAITDEDGYFTVLADEIINESEKAVQVVLHTGNIVGSGNGWKTWIPKSVVKGE